MTRLEGQDLVRLTLAAAQCAPRCPDAAELAAMVTLVQMDAVERLGPLRRGEWLARGLAAPHPEAFLLALRACAGLKRLLPEIDRLFGVPMLAAGRTAVDAGEHQLRVLAQAARAAAPLAVRLAALLHKIGMGQTPRPFWPSHVGHEGRGLQALAALVERITLPLDAVDLCAWAIREVDRVHRLNERNHGAVVRLYDRLQAQAQPLRSAQLLAVCACDYTAYPGLGDAPYPKRAALQRALAAYLRVAGEPAQGSAPLEARVRAIGRLLGDAGPGC